MTELAVLIDDNYLGTYMRKQIKQIKKYKNKVDPKNILTNLSDILKQKYVVNKFTNEELIIKIDKKRSEESIKKEIIDIIQNDILDGVKVNVSLLFKFVKNNNEFIIRTKRLV